MDLVVVIAGLALIEYAILLFLCGQARGRYEVAAPATVGNPVFERYFRVQMNTLEHLVLFVPGLFGFAWYVSEGWAAALGGVFLVGRALYARGYVRDPAGRGPGFLLTLASDLTLVFGATIGAALQLF